MTAPHPGGEGRGGGLWIICFSAASPSCVLCSHNCHEGRRRAAVRIPHLNESLLCSEEPSRCGDRTARQIQPTGTKQKTARAQHGRESHPPGLTAIVIHPCSLTAAPSVPPVEAPAAPEAKPGKLNPPMAPMKSSRSDSSEDAPPAAPPPPSPSALLPAFSLRPPAGEAGGERTGDAGAESKSGLRSTAGEERRPTELLQHAVEAETQSRGERTSGRGQKKNMHAKAGRQEGRKEGRKGDMGIGNTTGPAQAFSFGVRLKLK